MRLLRLLRLPGLGASAGPAAAARGSAARRGPRPQAPPAARQPLAPPGPPPLRSPPPAQPGAAAPARRLAAAAAAAYRDAPPSAAAMERPGAGEVSSNECENVSREKEMSEEFEDNAMETLVDMPFATIDIKDDCEIIDVPRINLERSKEKERICKDQIKKRKKKQKDYLPNYFLSIPITNKEVLFFQNLFLLLSFILNYI